MVDGLAGERVDSDLGHRHRGVFQLTVETQHLGPFTGVLHHLDHIGKLGTHDRRLRHNPCLKWNSDQVRGEKNYRGLEDGSGAAADGWKETIYHWIIWGKHAVAFMSNLGPAVGPPTISYNHHQSNVKPLHNSTESPKNN